MSLNDSKIRKLKPYSRPVKLSDSHGLYLLVNPGGSRIWYLKYRFNGKESRVSLGAYPLVSLAEATGAEYQPGAAAHGRESRLLP